jgi:hypothetical protein
MQSGGLGAAICNLGAQNGEAGALQSVFEITYDELRLLARGRRQAAGRMASLDTTTLVHECYLRFATAKRIAVEDRVHLLEQVLRVHEASKSSRGWIRGSCRWWRCGISRADGSDSQEGLGEGDAIVSGGIGAVSSAAEPVGHVSSPGPSTP